MLILGAYNGLQWLHKGAESNRKREAATENGSASLESWIQIDRNAISQRNLNWAFSPLIFQLMINMTKYQSTVSLKAQFVGFSGL